MDGDDMDPRKHDDEDLPSPRPHDDAVNEGDVPAGTGPREEVSDSVEEPRGHEAQGSTDGIRVQDTRSENPDAATGDVPVEPEPARADAVPQQSLALLDQDLEQAHTRWRDLQATFVDDPRMAVEQADGLVEEIVTTLTSSLTTRVSELRDRWENTDRRDTEQLRLALRDYRAMLEQLLALSGPQK
jgi:hypothetical protein